MDGLVEGVDVREGLVGEVMGLKIAPDRPAELFFARPWTVANAARPHFPPQLEGAGGASSEGA